MDSELDYKFSDSQPLLAAAYPSCEAVCKTKQGQVLCSGDWQSPQVSSPGNVKQTAFQVF